VSHTDGIAELGEVEADEPPYPPEYEEVERVVAAYASRSRWTSHLGEVYL
jgi:hypothetical protein